MPYYLYDIITSTDFTIPNIGVMKACAEIGIDSTVLPKLQKGASKQIYHRYILQSNKLCLFKLKEVDSGKEYECVNNASIFVHFGLPYNDNEAKYVYELRERKQKYASICGKVFCLVGSSDNKRVIPTKNKSEKLSAIVETNKAKRIIKSRYYSLLASKLRKAGTWKRKRFVEYLGCSSCDFCNYIESKFTNGMNWGNRHLWHIDHILPCSSFNLLNPREVLKCFHYTNLQPIWSTSKVALKMGETELYIGNQNKVNKQIGYDYFLAYSLSRIIENENDRIELSKFLFNKGIRKVLN